MSTTVDDRPNFHLASTVVWAAVGNLIEANRKTRRHAMSKIKKLAASVADTGYFNPILVTEAYEIIAGHARLEAAKRLGMGEVPVLILPGLSDAQKKALRLADNRLAEDATWNLEFVAMELSDIIEFGHSIELTGFDAIDADRLLTPKPVALDDGDEEIPDLPVVPVSRPGDCWACGEHLVGCGDATNDAFYHHLLWGQKADVVITDPPYNVAIPGNVSGLGKAHHANFAMASGEMSDEEFSHFLITVMERAKAHSRDGSVHFYFIDWRHVADMVAAGRQVFEKTLNICVWCKPNGGMGSLYRSQHEMIVVLKNGTEPHVNNVQLGRMGRYRSNVWHGAGGSSFSANRENDLADHPTVKPTPMIADAIRDVTMPSGLVLDPFGGSGTTILAAESVGRRAVLIEIDPKYVDVTLLRFRRATGIEPVLLPSRTPFSAVAAERQGLQNG